MANLDIEAQEIVRRYTEDTDKCMYQHQAKHKGDFRRELRHGNPDCACIECGGYNDECSCYTPRH